MINSINHFFQHIKQYPIELYNEAGFQYELAFFLRNHYPDYSVKLEYPTTSIFKTKTSFVKKEIDIYVTNKEGENFVIELKMPKISGGTPNEMYKVIEDIKFLEQLRQNGIKGCFEILITNHSAFWQASRANTSIYKCFNGEQINIQTLYSQNLPEFLKSKPSIELSKIYQTKWHDYLDIHNKDWKFFILDVS